MPYLVIGCELTLVSGRWAIEFQVNSPRSQCAASTRRFNFRAYGVGPLRRELRRDSS